MIVEVLKRVFFYSTFVLMKAFWTNHYLLLKIVLLLTTLVFNPLVTRPQITIFKNIHDTNYIYSYIEDFTARTFTSLSFVRISLHDNNIDKNLNYGIHSKLGFGFGFNYSIFGFNLRYSPKSNSVANSKYGETRSLDFRMNLYGRKFVFDLYLISHSGFYLSNPQEVFGSWENTGFYPPRPDIEVFSAGGVAQYLSNNKKYSLRATYLQNEWQKKSAGSFIVGTSFFYTKYSSDSSFVPTHGVPIEYFNGYKLNKSSSFNLGINGGYSHTFVLWKHFFLSAGLSVGPQLSYSTVSSANVNQNSCSGFRLGMNGLIRTGFGYNSRRVVVSLFFVDELIVHNMAAGDVVSYFNPGIFKLNFAYRFALGKPIKILNPKYWNFLQREND